MLAALATLLAACGGAAPPTVASGSGDAPAGTPTPPPAVRDAPPSRARVEASASPPAPTATAMDEPPALAGPDPDDGFFRGPSPDPAALARSPVVAVAELESVLSECSGLGGLHAIYRVSSQSSGHPVRRAHGGGHGVRALAGVNEANTVGFAGRRGVAPGRWFVVGLLPTARVDEDHDRNPDSGLAGWCLDRMPRTGAVVEVAVPVADRAAAEALWRAELARRAAAR